MNKTELINKYKARLILRNYSQRTVDVYVSALGVFVSYLQENHIEKVTPLILEKFFNYASSELNYGYSMMKQVLASVKFLYNDVLKEPIDFDFNIKMKNGQK